MDLESLRADLEQLRERALERIAASTQPDQIEQLTVDLLGKKGELTLVLRGIGALPAEDRPRVGAIANQVRQAIEAALDERGRELRKGAVADRLRAEALDVTTPGRPIPRAPTTRSPRPSPGSRMSSDSSASWCTRAPRSRMT